MICGLKTRSHSQIFPRHIPYKGNYPHDASPHTLGTYSSKVLNSIKNNSYPNYKDFTKRAHQNAGLRMKNEYFLRL
jgi:hypothetical protein